MNQKDYSEIVGIMRKYQAIEGIVLELADYFEKEDKQNVSIKKEESINFDRQQFLKECGVK